MKSKVIIENGKTTILLTPENPFEEDIITKVYTKMDGYTTTCDINAEQQSFGDYTKQKIEITITEN